MARTIILSLGLLLAAPLALAQNFIDCTGGCTPTVYGLGNDDPNGEGPDDGSVAGSKSLFPNSIGASSGGPGPTSTACSLGGWREFSFPGQIELLEQDTCEVSSTNRCLVEISNVPLRSGWSNVNSAVTDFGALGFFNVLGSLFIDVRGNLGYRQLLGSCTESGTECGIDADCTGGTDVCRSTCVGTGDPCSAEDDAACPGLCRTQIEWDGIGTCSDDSVMCTSDADCPVETTCEDGWQEEFADASCLCCQSNTGVLCPLVLLVEYPALQCPVPSVFGAPLRRGVPDWHFEGGRGTPFNQEQVFVEGQQEGVCTLNRHRPCGATGDLWAGAQNNKCADPQAANCPDPNDPNNPSLASFCNDVAFGGIAGDTCFLGEGGARNSPGSLLPDGTPNPAVCAGSFQRLVGNPSAGCMVPVDVPDNDPQPGCRLNAFGVGSSPDLDCDGVIDTLQGRCESADGTTCTSDADCPPCTTDAECPTGNCINNGDMCPFLASRRHFVDANNDDRGNECQCGDATGDGAVTSLDIGATALCANAVTLCESTLVDTDGDNAVTALDVGGVVAAVNGAVATTDLECPAMGFFP